MLAYDGPNARICCRCGCKHSRVINIRNDSKGFVKRRRECDKCKFRWCTVEIEQMAFEKLQIQSASCEEENDP